MSHTVRARLTLWNVSIVALVLIAIGVGIRVQVARVALQSIDDRLIQFGDDIQREVNTNQPSPFRDALLGIPGPPRGGFGRMFRGHGRRSTLPPVILDRSGKDLTGSWKLYDLGAASEAWRGRRLFTTVTIAGDSYRVMSMPLMMSGKVAGVLQLPFSTRAVTTEVNHLTSALIAFAPIALFLSALTGALLTNNALRPVRSITQACDAIESGTLSDRLPVNGADEFAGLSVTLNRMLARIEAAFAQMDKAYRQLESFTADASHEIRSPLTVIKANTSIAMRDDEPIETYRYALSAADRAADRIDTIVESLMLLARLDSSVITASFAPVCVSSAVTRAIELCDNGVGAVVSLNVVSQSAVVAGNEEMLVRLFENLVSNGKRYTPADGCVSVSVRPDGDQAEIRVEDTGVGIEPEQLAHIFERFYRVDRARARESGGTGLGLSICKSIAAIHRGGITVTSEVGVGSTFTVRIPLLQAD
ncbi:MAG TPA: ATP-binding protein [Capsulimonadaceae bacterium]